MSDTSAEHSGYAHGTVWSYTAGFVGSLIATGLAYVIVADHLVVSQVALGWIVALAIIQLLIQLVLFLHIGKRTPFWNMAALFFALVVVIIVVVGSLWIMYNLNTRMMLPGEQLQYMQNEG